MMTRQRTQPFKPLDHLNGLRTFVTVVRQGSFQGASEQLNVTPGAVSRAIRQLEVATGCPLFDRLHRRVKLTEQGRTLAKAASPLFDGLTKLSDIIDRESVQRYILAAPATFLLRWMIPRQSALQEILDPYPLELRSLDGPPSYGNHDVTAFIDINNALIFPDFDRYHLTQDRFAMVCSPEYQRQERATRLIAMTQPRLWEHWLEAGGAEPDVGGDLTFERLHFAIRAAEAGLGMTVAPVECVKDAVISGQLVFPFGVINRPAEYSLYINSENARRSEVRKAREWLLQSIQDAAPLT